jgi:hypothetical protein
MNTQRAIDMTNEDFSLPRTGQLPLVFSGRLLGSGELGKRFWTRVDLYRTEGGAYVVHVTHGSHHEDNQGESRATVCQSVPDVIEAMRDRAGKLGGASTQALTQAAHRDSGIRDLATERVE